MNIVTNFIIKGTPVAKSRPRMGKFGTYDTKNSKSRDFMDGILTVIEFIAYYAGDEGFVAMFCENMLKCENEERENEK